MVKFWKLFNLPCIGDLCNFRNNRDAFPYTQCEMGTITQRSLHACYHGHDSMGYGQQTWIEYLDGRNKTLHPCLTENQDCCNFWTSALQNQLQPMMKVSF